jgi:hypothetical protein
MIERKDADDWLSACRKLKEGEKGRGRTRKV